jgi:arylformamidase
MLIRLSYALNRHTPLYPGTDTMKLEPAKSIEKGDSSNTTLITFNGHSGTHIDAPNHFCGKKMTISELLKPENIIEGAVCIDIPKTGDSPVTPEDIKPFRDEIRDTEALFIRTGSGDIRDADPDTYATVHPWIHPDVPDYLREICPELRFFGLDAISVAVPSFRQEGRETHRNFLCKSPEIMLIEDLNLSSPDLTGQSWRLRFYPVVFDRTDGVPVLAFAELYG